MAFNPGDTVRMKSGGPLMTVMKIDQSGQVWCEWFNEKNEPKKAFFTASSLVADNGSVNIA